MSSELPKPDSLSGWLSLLEALHPTDIDMGLERVADVYDALSFNFESATVITVAGTNGKGSTCRFIELLARKLGYTTGVYSSPHITDYTERVRINAAELSEAQHCAAFEQVFTAFQQVKKRSSDISLTYFEFGTLAALSLLMEHKPDVIILEVGLGGRLDAVNIVEPDISVITTIGVDHQVWLGDTREEIAVEKAGIARKAIPCIVGEQQPPDTLITTLAEIDASAIWVNNGFCYQENNNDWHFEFDQGEQKIQFGPLPFGALLTQNIATALATACQIGWPVTQQLVADVITAATLPGRYQQLEGQRKVILDVAHNHQATAILAKKIKAEDFRSLFIIVGMLSDKDSISSLAEFKHLDAKWLLSPLDSPRSASSEVLNSALSFTDNKTCCVSVADAWQQANAQAGREDLILVFGSFFTVSEFKQAIQFNV